MTNVIDTPIRVYDSKVCNRVVFQPMEGCDGTAEGAVGELTRRRYLRFAASGAGIIWFEATAVCPEGRANPRQLYLSDSTKNSFRALLSEIRSVAMRECGFTPLIIAQLTHSGRFSKPHGVPEPVVAYRNELWEQGKEKLPYVTADDEYCKKVVCSYGNAAALAKEVGFDGIDVKCCHGYLLNEFLSAKQRGGMYGGSLENRTRLYFECIDSVKRAVGDSLFVTTRLNACDCFPYPFGFGVNENNEINLSETKAIINELGGMGIELVNITLGNPYLIPHINRPCTDAPEDGRTGMERIYSVTKELKASSPNTLIVASGLSYEGTNAVGYAQRLIEDGVADLAGFGRMTFAYPEFYRDFLDNGKLDKNKVCLKCSKCTQLMRSGSVTGCPVRDSGVYMPLYKKYVLKKEV